MRRYALICSLVLSLTALTGICRAEPVNCKELIPILASVTLPGWNAGTPKGQTVKSPFEASEASVEFTQGEKRLEVAIYEGGPQMGAALAAIGQIEMESSDISIKPTEIQGCKGSMNISKTDNEADLLISVGNRLVVSLHLGGSTDGETLKAAAGQLDLKKLASLSK